MKRFLLYAQLALLLTALYPLALSAQQNKDKNSLLWRISGNGLSKPSWLYGTIHLVDKRVFNFGDSLYAALEACEGYAMELVPDSMATFYLNDTRDGKTLKQVVDAKTFDRLKKKLKEQFDKKPEEVTVKEFKAYFTKKINNPNNKDAMPVIMDAWFYSAARRQGKWVGGIEDTEDQRDIGGNLSFSFYVNDFLNDHRSSKQMLDQMINIYKEEDLEGIEMIEEATGNGAANNSMLRRNRKMAFRMDSLAHIRSMFFAVGAGHLPGDSGVISYLRRKGYTVQPVSSSKRIPADTWHFPVKEVPWVTVTASSGAFTVQLPGEPQETGLVDESMDMKIYADITSNIVYLAMSVDKKDNLDIDSMMTQVVKNMNKKARVVESHDIKRDSVRGKEIIAKSDEAVFRLQCFYRPPMAYVALITSPLDTLVRSADAERFFKSLVMHKKVKSDYIPWSTFTGDRHAFSLKFPGRPAVRKGPGDERTMISTLYSSIDTKNDIFFQCLVQDMKKGFYLTGDTTVFRLYLNALDSNEATHLLSRRMDTLQQYPAMWLDFTMTRDENTYYNKVLSLHRGNRLYFIIATAGDSLKARQHINNYFSSFSFLPAKEGKWSQQEAPDNSFTTWAASAVTRYVGPVDEEEENDNSKEIYFEIYDSTAPCTYYVSKSPYPRNFWAESDTTLLRRTVDDYVGYSDSLLSYTPVANGHHRGVEVVIRLADNHNVKKARLLIVGDTLFTIYGIVPPAVLALDNSRRLFTGFRVNHTTPPTIFTNKAAALLQALQSPDSVVFQEAKATLKLVNFTKADLPLLHKAMLEWYRDSAEYNAVNGTLFDYITILRDESTLTVVQEVWDKLPAGKEKLRYNLLGLLGRYRTAASVSLAKDLLLRHIPREGNAWELFSSLEDTLELLKPIFPELLPLLKDSLAAPEIITLAARMLDSNYVDVKLIANYKGELYQMTAHALKMIQQVENYSLYTNFALIRVLARLKEPVANQWVRKFLLQANLSLKQVAVIALLEHGQPVAAAELLKLAADNEQRIGLYEDLVKIKKEALFPRQYLTEQAFGQSELHDYASEDNEVKKITFIGERVALYKGVRKKFFLYKVDMSYDDEKIIHLGIAGPYGLKPAKPVTETKATGIYWEQEYNPAKIDTYLKAYLKEQEQYEEQ
ncbi:TraB/GumN family protein [Pseudoflavitalea sp. X16]|uniref:TraB/GumN family protein n=1 Tax=Paraflavitalea devenefica TaxID=2716334 RepID=UPI00141F21BB|nr:TraB/GumN family protein [Paraflavitalea devenefica]NII24970.1 TraB/GumN family protein [Paraflavitalea devenefica]